MRKCYLLCVVAVLSVLAVSQNATKTEAPKPGGRPGRFMFATNDEIVADTAQRKQVREMLATMRSKSDKLAKNSKAKQELLANVAFLEKFVNSVEERQTRTSSSTSSIVVNLLNDKKGVADCAFCHTEDDPHEPARSRKGK